MGFLKALLWTLGCVGLGILLATVEIDGRTPLEHARHAWRYKVHPSKLEQLKGSFGDALDGAKDKLEDAREAFGKDKDAKPRERHSAEDREALNKLIAKRAAR